MEAVGKILRKVIPELFKEAPVFRVVYEDRDGGKYIAYVLAKNQKEVLKKLKGHTIIKLEKYNPQLGVGA